MFRTLICWRWRVAISEEATLHLGYTIAPLVEPVYQRSVSAGNNRQACGPGVTAALWTCTCSGMEVGRRRAKGQGAPAGKLRQHSVCA